MNYNTIILNSSHVVPNSNNSRYSFPFQSPVQFKNASMALTNLQMYYSWFNVSRAYNNTTFFYTWIDGSVNQVDINEGSYSIDTLNMFLQQVMINNQHYLYDTVNAENVYYLQIRSNVTYYCFEISASPVPTSLPQGHTKPGAWAFQQGHLNVLKSLFYLQTTLEI